jgi:AcrR family transcriptional regulator
MEIRTKILEAALQVFAETGYRGATTRRIAQIADVNEVTLFRQFGSKDDLLRSAMEYATSEDQIPRLPAEPGDPLAELTDWAMKQHARLRTRGPIIRNCLSLQTEHPEMAECICHGPLHVAKELARYFGLLRSNGWLKEDADFGAAISMLMASLFTDAMTRDVMKGLYPTSSDEAIRRAVALIWSAIGQPRGN